MRALIASGFWPRVIRYGMSGGTAAVVYVGVGVLLHRAGLAPAWAPYLAYASGFVTSYSLHALFTFQDRLSWRSFVPVLITAIIGIFASSAAVQALLTMGSGPLVAYLAGVAVNAALGFTANSVIFRGRRAFAP